jgi:hypothetical protein
MQSSSNPSTSQQSPTVSLDNNNSTLDTNTNLERLKQQSQHCNGNNTHNHSISTQTNHSTLNTQLFTNSQKEVLRLIGQHLQSVGLGYKNKIHFFSSIFLLLVKPLIFLSPKVVVYLNMNKLQIFVNLLCPENGQKYGQKCLSFSTDFCTFRHS